MAIPELHARSLQSKYPVLAIKGPHPEIQKTFPEQCRWKFMLWGIFLGSLLPCNGVIVFNRVFQPHLLYHKPYGNENSKKNMHHSGTFLSYSLGNSVTLCFPGHILIGFGSCFVLFSLSLDNSTTKKEERPAWYCPRPTTTVETHQITFK